MKNKMLAWSLLILSLNVEADIVATATIQNDDSAGCTVNFADTLNYVKPACITPDEAPESTANEYWVNLSGGSGSTCSQASPCDSFADLSGKSTSGGAKVYVKGNGRLDVTSGTFAGTSTDYIHIQPWPADSTPTVLTAAAGCGTGNANQLTASGWRYVLFDGGADMLIRFVGSGCTSSQNGYTAVVNSNDVTLWRVRLDGNDSSGPVLGVATTTSANHLRFINSEMYNNDSSSSYYGVYAGGGSGCPGGTNGHQNLEFRNSIFRGIDGRGIQIEPRGASDGVVIDSNAFHGVGYNTNSGISGDASGAVQVADACGVTTGNIRVSNNLMWDLGGGGVLMFQDCLTCYAVNNTIWDYGNATPASLNSHAIVSWTDSTSYDFEFVYNNIVLGPGQGGINPLWRDLGWTSNDNACGSGSSCGSGAIICTAASCFDSTSNTSSFLKPNGAALGSCVVIAGFETDYLGVSRGAAGAATDCGAINEP